MICELRQCPLCSSESPPPCDLREYSQKMEQGKGAPSMCLQGSSPGLQMTLSWIAPSTAGGVSTTWAQTHVHTDRALDKVKDPPSILILVCRCRLPIAFWGKGEEEEYSTGKERREGRGKTGKGVWSGLFIRNWEGLGLPKLEVLSAFMACSSCSVPSLWEMKTTGRGKSHDRDWNHRGSPMSSDTSYVNPGKATDFSKPYLLSVRRW